MPEHSRIRARPEVESVFVLRPDNLGDVVLFTGALKHLRSLFPRAEITLCVKRYVRELLELCPYVDRLATWEDLHSHCATRSVRGIGRLEAWVRRRQLRDRHAAQVALLPVRSAAPGMHAMLSALDARERYGIAGCHSNQTPADDVAAAPLYTGRLALDGSREWDHELEVTRDFLRLLGAEVELAEVQPEFWTSAADATWAESRLPAGSGPWNAVAPGVSAPAGKAYPAAAYEEALAGVSKRPCSIVLIGSAADATECAELEGRLRAGGVSVLNLAGRTTVRQMVECLRRVDLLLGADAAPLHVAIGLGKPTVGIVGGGHFGRFHPWGDPERNRVVNQRMECFGCDWACRFATLRCVQEVAPAAVAKALDAVASPIR